MLVMISKNGRSVEPAAALQAIQDADLRGGFRAEAEGAPQPQALPTQRSRLPRSPSTNACSPSNTMRVKLLLTVPDGVVLQLAAVAAHQQGAVATAGPDGATSSQARSM